MNAFGLESIWARANDGPVVSARLVPLSNQGDVRVTYNWLYSALNCVPSDTSVFEWVLAKANGKVTLSPQVPFNGRKLYGSVRPIWEYFIQVQAERSADWITAIGADEELTLHELGFFVIGLQGVNGKYLTVNGATTDHAPHSGFRIQSNAGDASAKASRFFLAVQQVLQPQFAIPTARSLGAATIAQSLADMGVADATAMANRIVNG